jgi:hypothetical protein
MLCYAGAIFPCQPAAEFLGRCQKFVKILDVGNTVYMQHQLLVPKETGHLWLYYIYMTVFIRNAANLAHTTQGLKNKGRE